jgi:uncharacterized protein (DUF58 family)
VTIRPGRGMLWIGIGLVAAVPLTLFSDAAIWLVPLALGAACVLALLDYRQLRAAWSKISVTRELPQVVARGSDFNITLRIKNTGADLFEGELRDVFPKEAQPAFFLDKVQVAAGADTGRRATAQIPVRGRYAFGPVWLRLAGRYSMLEAQKPFECRDEVRVLPDNAISNESLDSNEMEKSMLDKMTHSRLHGTGLEFESLAEFQPGDDPRRIDWRSSARHRRLVIRRYQLEQHRDVMVVLDCGRLMGASAGNGTKLDRAVDSALLLSRVALDKGDRCGLAVFDDQVLGYLPPLSGAAAQGAIMDCVYNVQSRWRESNFGTMFATLQTRQQKRALVIVISDLVDASTSLPYRAALASLAKRHLVVFAALQTPLFGQTVRALPETVIDVTKKAIALKLLRERERALYELSRSGVHVLDVEPSHLTVPLVNRYIQLRERNLL